MRSIIVGTAGHIDHGKTALVRALTGIDTDRLKEEKRRGITIELGFAHLELGDTRLGIVDVPGHERFVKSMVAGATGMDLVMLVVAADEGVMPQTREHLDICQLLGVQRGLVALTKADLVDEDWRALAIDDVRQTLRGSFLEEAPIIACSAIGGLGIESLKQSLGQLAELIVPRNGVGLLRLPLDRVFSVKGFGTVVTGTLASGTLRVGDTVEVLPQQRSASVRRLQVHNVEVESAVAGQRTAVNLGGVLRAEISRGEVLAHPKTLLPSHLIDAEVGLLPGANKGLKARSKVLFHLGTRQQEATCVLLEARQLEPGSRQLAQLRFESPIIATPGDRFILRSFSRQENYGTTIGGGRVVRVLSRRLRPKDTAGVELLDRTAAATGSERVALEVLNAGPSGLSVHALLERLPIARQELERNLDELVGKGELTRFDKETGAVCHRLPLADLQRRLSGILEHFHRERPLEAGISREELRNKVGAFVPQRLFFVLLNRLAKSQEIVAERDLVRAASHQLEALDRDALVDALEALCEERGLAAPREQELGELLGAPLPAVSKALRILSARDVVSRIGGMVFSNKALAHLEQKLREYLEVEREIDAASFKVLVGLSRKFTIPLAEYFDSQKVTIRIGDLRRLRG